MAVATEEADTRVGLESRASVELTEILLDVRLHTEIFIVDGSEGCCE